VNPAQPRPNLLFLAHRVPHPPDKGDRIRTYNLLRFLAPRAAVHLACLADEPVAPETTAMLHRLCTRVAVIPVDEKARWTRALWSLARGRTASEGAFNVAELWRTLAAWTRGTRFDAAFVSASSLVPYARSEALHAVPAVVDLVDVDSQKWFDYAAASRPPRSWLYRLEGRRLRRLERDLPAWARAVTLVSPAEAELYRSFAVPGPIEAIGNGVDVEFFRPDAPVANAPGSPNPPVANAPGSPSCVFVGAFDYRPNVDGACWFCREVWPGVRARRPEARLYLVGRRPVAAVRRLARVPGVEVVGQVPDVRPYLARALVAVVPLRIARGLQNKVLEALASGKPTIASPQALAGIAAEPSRHLLAADAPEQWREAILKLFDDAPLRRSLAAAGRQYVEEHHSWERCLEPFGRLLGVLPAAAVNVSYQC
jgi:sugar transferase (PEP-CTERM/EpsH1 system associated)